MPDDVSSRLYDLRVAALTDARLREAVAGALARWLPAEETSVVIGALGDGGFVTRLRLSAADASALLRDLYATAVSPASVVLRPRRLDPPREGEGSGPDPAIFTQHGGRFVPTWNWRAFVFGPLWYLNRGLYGKGLVLLVLSICPVWSLGVTVLVSCVVLVYCGAVGNWDDYLWRVKGTQWW